eukprot:803949-Pelagomonas_calceolata.AAC.3
MSHPSYSSLFFFQAYAALHCTSWYGQSIGGSHFACKRASQFGTSRLRVNAQARLCKPVDVQSLPTLSEAEEYNDAR